jgi:putative nucleotidyltransferase with HDIG domain
MTSKLPIAGIWRPVARHIRWKIVGPYLVLALIGAFVGTFVVTQLVTSSLSDRFTNQLVEAARVMEDSTVRQERRHLEAVRTVAFTEGLLEALESGDKAELDAIVLPIAVNSGVASIEVLDASGRVVAGFVRTADGELEYREVAAGVDRRSLPPVAAVVTGSSDALGDKYAGIVAMDGGYRFLTVGPVSRDGVVVGAVAVGTGLQEFLGGAQKEVLAQITLYGPDGAPIASTFATPDDGLPRAGSEAGARETISLFGREYEVLYRPLVIRGQPLGWYSVGLPTSFITSAQDSTRLRLGVLFAVGALLILLVGLVLARAITRPLLRLVRSAVQLGKGDLTVRADVDSQDEVGVLAKTFNDMAARLERQHLATLGALVSAIDARDPYTRGHSVRVGQLSVEIGRELGMDRGQLHHLQVGGYLHDIGKIGIRDAILLKAGGLTGEERAIIEQHPRIGLEILSHIELPGEVLAIVGQHHEKLNGSGYPARVGEAELTVFPRIAAVADIYDAVSTTRPYREAMSFEETLDLLRREAMSGLLDPDVVRSMARIAEAWERRREVDPALQALFTLGPASEQSPPQGRIAG